MTSDAVGRLAKSDVIYVSPSLLLSPLPAMLEDTSAIYVRNVAPFDRFRSNGSALLPEAAFVTDAAGNIIGLAGGIMGPLTTAVWFKVPSIFRLRFTGTGTATIDAKDSLGNISTSVATYTLASATDQIEYPYLGEYAVMIRATLTGNVTAEVI